MADAVRNVTIVMNIQPGDMSAVKAAIKELNEMKGIYEDVGASVQKLNAEQQSLGKTQAETARQERELITIKKEGAEIDEKANRDQIENIKKRAEAEQKIETDNVAKIERIRRPLRDPSGPGKDAFTQRLSLQAQDHNSDQAERAKRNEEAAAKRREAQHKLDMQRIDLENAIELRKYEEKVRKEEAAEEAARQRAMQKRHEEMQKGIDNLLRDIARKEEAEKRAAEKRQEDADKVLQRIRVSELRNIREREAEEAQAEQKRFDRAQALIQKIKVSELRAVREREAEEAEAEEKRLRRAEETFKKIRVAELKNAREMREESEQASADMPKHWRNVGLNAGQAVASAARYISHMRMLKNVGGDTLESMAKQFMTIQSRIETIAASTSFFTNVGTMASGLQTAGQAMEKVIRQQQIMRQEATFVQTATVGIGKAATSVLPFIAPLQLGFTLVTAGIVAADIAMDFFGDSSEAALEKARENAQKFDDQLAKTIGKLETERQLIASQNDLLELQWQMKQRIAGEENVNTSDVMKHQEKQRAAREAELEAEHKRKATEIFEGGLTEEEKARRGKLAEERAKLEEENRKLNIMITTIRENGMHIGNREMMGELANAQIQAADNNFRLDQIYAEQEVLDAGAYSGTGVDTIDIQNGQIVNFDQHMADLDKIQDKEKRKKAQALYAESLQQSNALIVQQQAEAERRAKDEKAKAEQAARDAEKLKREQEAERAMAINYSMEDSQWRANDARQEMQNFQNAQTPEEKARAAREAQRLLQGQGGEQANLLTPELQAQLSLGAAADPAQVISMIDDASVYDQGEQATYDQAVAAATKAKQEAEAQSAAMLRLAETLQEVLKENKRQVDALQRAIENRDL